MEASTILKHTTIQGSILTQRDINAMHLKEIYLKALYQNGISRAQLKREMHLSFPSISALVDEMLGKDVLYEVGIQERTQRGRPQTMLRVNPSVGCPVELSGTPLKDRSYDLSIE